MNWKIGLRLTVAALWLFIVSAPSSAMEFHSFFPQTAPVSNDYPYVLYAKILSDNLLIRLEATRDAKLKDMTGAQVSIKKGDQETISDPNVILEDKDKELKCWFILAHEQVDNAVILLVNEHPDAKDHAVERLLSIPLKGAYERVEDLEKTQSTALLLGMKTNRAFMSSSANGIPLRSGLKIQGSGIGSDLKAFVERSGMIQLRCQAIIGKRVEALVTASPRKTPVFGDLPILRRLFETPLDASDTTQISSVRERVPVLDDLPIMGRLFALDQAEVNVAPVHATDKADRRTR